MRRKIQGPSRAQRPRRVLLLVLLIANGCSNSGAAGLKFRAPTDSPQAERPTGCIDTPFISPDHRSTTSGVQCGREASPEALVVRGRVVSETVAGLPGAGLEGLWVSVHAFDGRLELSRLPPPRSETKTGPQGAFAVSLTRAGEYVIAVRAEPGGPVLAARRIEAGVEAQGPELLLLVSQPSR